LCNSFVAADSFAFGMSPYGCYNMAGNVKEWCRNEATAGFLTAGGSWEDPLYMFARYGVFAGFYSSSALGFRCVRLAAKSAGDQGAMTIRCQPPCFQLRGMPKTARTRCALAGACPEFEANHRSAIALGEN
jgi:hypothetical protein